MAIGKPLALSQRRGRFVVPARLREEDRGQRMHEREVTPVAGGVQRRRRLGEMVADDARVADLLVAERQLVVGEANGARIVRELGVLQRARVQRDGARLLAARERDPAVQAPERRELRVGERLAHRVGRAAERGGCLRRGRPAAARRRSSAARTASSSSRLSEPERSSGVRSWAASVAAPALEGGVGPAEHRLRSCLWPR